MDRDTLNLYLATILDVLNEYGSAPRSIVMFGVNLDSQPDTYAFLENILVKGDLVTVTPDVITITDKGREMHKRVQASLARK